MSFPSDQSRFLRTWSINGSGFSMVVAFWSHQRLCSTNHSKYEDKEPAIQPVEMYFSKLFLASAAVASVYAAVLEARATNTNLQTIFPASAGSSALPAAVTVAAGATFDGGMKKYDRSGQYRLSSVIH